MCQKQCRDENGFKCHTMSESHQRQLLLFAENPDKYIDQFSQEFLDDFMHLLKRRFGTKRVHANQVYQEYISDRNHLHMNATQWETLTEFVKWLGQKGHCNVDETEKGWFISYIDRDPETIMRQEALKKQKKMKLDSEERMAKFMQQQMQFDQEKSRSIPDTVYTELKRNDDDEKIVFSMKSEGKFKKPVTDLKQNPLVATTSKTNISSSSTKKGNDEQKRKRALDEIIEQEQRIREKKSRSDYWLAPGIIAKVVSKKLGEEFYKKKVIVKEVQDHYFATVQLIDSNEETIAHQKHLETVIPNIGRKVKVLNGAYRGCEALLLEVNFDSFSVKVKITSGIFKGKILDGVKYEDVSKLEIQT
ncbi:hypothetical protein CDAR_184011 [Caerostris darwini]|uniref:DNA/RNA-binding protein Kin17 WH-like domain-containing protein n=1 Tax=Caerostris darwini TaxID=1538125 RepID=A0AAV4TY15_9ARAC|nr:hypothetical protein CDAR_184011 [Caerostris darwini]